MAMTDRWADKQKKKKNHGGGGGGGGRRAWSELWWKY